MFQDFWNMRPQVGVAVSAKHLNITGTGGGRELKVGTCNHLKNIKDAFQDF